MNNIQKKIQELEFELKLENYFIDHDYTLFKQIINWQKTFPIVLISGFIIGYLLSQKKIFVKCVYGIATLGILVNQLYKMSKWIY